MVSMRIFIVNISRVGLGMLPNSWMTCRFPLCQQNTDRLEAPVSTEEVLAVIKKLKRCSAPGPDGFSTPYYKTFANTLAPFLAKFINSKIKRGASGPAAECCIHHRHPKTG